MKIIKNTEEIHMNSIEITINSEELCSFFELKTNSIDELHNIGEKIKILSDEGELIIEGEIEEIKTSNISHMYYGRNKTKNLYKSFFDKNYLFPSYTKLKNILDLILGNYNLNIEGEGNYLEISPLLFERGEDVIKSLMKTSELMGNRIYSTANSNLIIDDKKHEVNESITLSTEYNIHDRSRIINNVNLYDKYTVFTNTGYSSYGQGKREKIITPNINMTSIECERYAKNEYKKDKDKSFLYICNIAPTEKIKLNTAYSVSDHLLNIQEKMIVRKIIHTHNNENKNTKLYLRRIFNDF